MTESLLNYADRTHAWEMRYMQDGCILTDVVHGFRCHGLRHFVILWRLHLLIHRQRVSVIRRLRNEAIWYWQAHET